MQFNKPKQLTKRERKAETGPNAMVERSLNKGHNVKSRNGRVYRGINKNIFTGASGLPFVISR